MTNTHTLTLLILTQLGPSAYAGNWTKAMKVRSELQELIKRSPNRNENTINNITVIDPSLAKYKVSTNRCELLVSFVYKENNPEKGIKRKIISQVVSGSSVKCANFFRE